MRYVVYLESNGEIVREVSGSPAAVAQQAGPGEAIAPGSGSWHTHRVVDGAVVELDAPREPPHTGAQWDREAAAWFDPRPLAQQQADRWAEVKAARDAAICRPLVTPYGVFDATPASQTKITNAVLLMSTLKAMGSTDGITFTLANNTDADLTADQMIHVGLLLGQQTQAAYAVGRALRAQIDAAATPAELDGLNWPT